MTFDKASFGKRFGVNTGERSDDPNALNIYEATERSFSLNVPHEMRDSALEYELKLYNGASVRALIYLVYAEPLRTTKSATMTPALGLNGAPLTDDGGDNEWLPVTRARCAKGCVGPILSAIQRFGKQGRTQKGGAGKEPAKPDSGQDKWKDARNLFISIDEASNHVCAFGPNKCKVFRCVAARFSSRPLDSTNGRFPKRNNRHGRAVARFAKRPFFFPELRADGSLTRPLASSATTGFCSGSSPRTAPISWAAAFPAPSASSPTTTCPRARRASGSGARSQVRARLGPPPVSLPSASVSGPRGTSPGTPGTSRGRARASRATPSHTPHRPRPPPGAPWRAPGCPGGRRARGARVVGALTPPPPLLPPSSSPQPTGRAGSPPSRSTRTARRSPPPTRTPRPGARRTAAAARPSPRGASAP